MTRRLTAGRPAPSCARAIFEYIEGFVRHEALLDRAGCKTPPPGCRSSPVKLRAV
ncbi:MAG: hypothetical protein ACLPZR_31760 [Solirubrobacteraceae bacterium]